MKNFLSKIFATKFLATFLLISGCQTANQEAFAQKTAQGNNNSVDSFIIGKRQYLNGNYDRALANLLKSIEKNQSLPDPYIYIGNIYFQKNDQLNSIKFYNKAIEIDKDNLSANRNLLAAHLKEAHQILNNLEKSDKTSIDLKNRTSKLNKAIEVYVIGNKAQTRLRAEEKDQKKPVEQPVIRIPARTPATQ